MLGMNIHMLVLLSFPLPLLLHRLRQGAAGVFPPPNKGEVRRGSVGPLSGLCCHPESAESAEGISWVAYTSTY